MISHQLSVIRKNCRTPLGVICCSLFTYIAPCCAAEKHPLEIQLEKCIGSKISSVDMRECIYASEKKWDEELNKNYKTLLNLIKDPAIKSKLRETQIEWIKFRDTEIKFIGEFYSSFEGTMWLDVIADKIHDLTKDRAQKLKEYIQTYTEEK